MLSVNGGWQMDFAQRVMSQTPLCAEDRQSTNVVRLTYPHCAAGTRGRMWDLHNISGTMVSGVRVTTWLQFVKERTRYGRAP